MNDQVVDHRLGHAVTLTLRGARRDGLASAREPRCDECRTTEAATAAADHLGPVDERLLAMIPGYGRAVLTLAFLFLAVAKARILPSIRVEDPRRGVVPIHRRLI